MQILKEVKHFWGSNISALRQIVTLGVGIVSMWSTRGPTGFGFQPH